jgi:hypothetical protein
MSDGVLIALFGAACLAAAFWWRTGPFLAIASAFLQEPLRKVMPGAPVILVLAPAVIWLCSLAGAMAAREIRWTAFAEDLPNVNRAILLMAMIMAVGFARTALFAPGAWKLAMLGLLTNAGLLAGLIYGYAFPRAERDILRVLQAYVLFSAASMAGGVLEHVGVQHVVLGSGVFGADWVTHRTGEAVRMLSGFFRSPDVFGWHAAMLVMLGVTLSARLHGGQRWFWVALSVTGAIGAVLCARRKMFAMLPIYIAVVLLMHLLQGHVRRARVLVGLLLLLTIGGVVMYEAFGRAREAEHYYATTTQDAAARFLRDGVGSVLETLEQAGPAGYGLGMATQGARYVEIENRPRVWQEGALDKLAAELGVPGLAGMLLLVLALGVAMVSQAQRLSAAPIASSLAGLIAVQVSNASASIVSGQILGDPFIAIFLPMLAGFCLSAARVRVVPEPAAA